MKLTILILLFITSVAVFAQPTVDQSKPNPLATKNSQILPEDGFTITFPAKPVRKVKPFQSAFGSTDMINYELSSPLAYYIVNYFDFPTILSKTEIDVRLELMKNATVSSSPQNRLMRDNEIMFGDNHGLEFVTEGADYTIATRGIFVKQRFFQITVITKGRNTTATKRLRDYNEKLARDFFNSFVVNHLPSAQITPVELPADFGVISENGSFSSGFFKFSMSVPRDWQKLDDEETEVAKDLGIQSTGRQKSKVKGAYLATAIENTKILLLLTSPGNESIGENSIFMIAAERVAFPNFLPSMVIKSYARDFITDDQAVTRSTNLEKIGGEDFAWMELQKAGLKQKQRVYVSNQGGVAFQIIYTYETDTQLKEMLALLKTVKFDK